MHGGRNWNVLTYAQAEALEMIQHKIGRILAGDPNVLDHWADIVGYAQLVANILETGEKRAKATAEDGVDQWSRVARHMANNVGYL